MPERFVHALNLLHFAEAHRQECLCYGSFCAGGYGMVERVADKVRLRGSFGGNVNPKNQVQTANLGHPPSLYTFPEKPTAAAGRWG